VANIKLNYKITYSINDHEEFFPIFLIEAAGRYHAAMQCLLIGVGQMRAMASHQGSR
jgi:hypothetical protein